MNTVFRDIFRVIHEGKWLSIEYRNKEERITKYWIGIRNLDVRNRTLEVDGFHLGYYTVETFPKIKIDSILSSRIVEGSYCPVNRALVKDIYLNPHKYTSLFENTANLKILSYLEMCNRLDTTPYISDFTLLHCLDRERLQGELYQLNQEQFQAIVKNFQYHPEGEARPDGGLHIRQLAINVLSIHTNKGLYVLAYRKLNLDVKQHVLKQDAEITVCTQFTLDGTVQSIRRYLDAEEYELLSEFEANQEKIKDCITKHIPKQGSNVDDMPYIIGLGMDIPLDLHKEYASIIKMYQENKVPIPIKAFFGDLLERPRRTAAHPIALINQRINMDQLLAIHNAMKYPVAYIQGPPGTGKTNTIINTIVTAFFNERTVLFASYNNHPINSVYEKLSRIKYKGKTIPFPILRLGNNQKIKEALVTMQQMYESVKRVQVFEGTLDRNKDDRKKRARRLSELLKRYEELLDLKERGETIDRLLDYEKKNALSMQMISFEADLSGRQRRMIDKKIESAGTVSETDAISLLDDDIEELKKYLYYTSARYIQKIGNSRNSDLKAIIELEDEEKRVEAFVQYLAKKENIVKLQKIFPIIATTCISAHRLGEAEPMFDMVIMDEASQCNTAVSLVPIVRGESLMLVGDPQQLNPVILLDEVTNVTCGTVHAFQGDEKDVVLFSTAITNETQAGTYEWLKNNKELINVATSRARDKLILLSSSKNLERLHQNDGDDDLYELAQYVKSNGTTTVTPKQANSRALGVKPFSSVTEEAFLQNLNHALENIWMTQSRYAVHKEVPIAHVFWENEAYNDLFYSGRFDFVVYEKQEKRDSVEEVPILAIELDGKEHFDNEVVKNRDKKKNAICKAHNLQIIRVENSYARRYNHIKEILINYFSIIH